jgi:predicted MFS family arabinose efflux permease
MCTETSPLSRAAHRRAGRTEVAASVTLAAIAFIVVTGETTPVGLLSDVARGVRAGESKVGLVISWYALIAGATAVPLTRLSSRFDRRRVLVSCVVVFAAGHVVTALATSIPVLLLGRGVAALGHGVYFAVAVPAALRLARPEAKGRAGGRVAVGAASAFVLGTPLSTLLGQATGWRTVMVVIAGLSIVLAVAVARVLPPLPALHLDQPRSAGGVPATLRSRELIVVLGVTLSVVVAHFALFTYVAPYADERLGVRGTALTVLLLAYGLAAVFGSALGGRLADRAPVAGVWVAAAAFVVALVGLWFVAHFGSPVLGVPLLVLWSAAFSTLAVSTALAVLRRVRGPQAETANALHGIVFQVGIVAGSALGSLCYAAGLLSAAPLAAAAVGLTALVLLAFAGRCFRRGSPG